MLGKKIIDKNSDFWRKTDEKELFVDRNYFFKRDIHVLRLRNPGRGDAGILRF